MCRGFDPHWTHPFIVILLLTLYCLNMRRTSAVIFLLAIISGLLSGMKLFNPLPQINSIVLEPTIPASLSPVAQVSPTSVLVSPRFVTVRVDEVDISVETARTATEIEQGLSGRNIIGADGMLFFIQPARTPTFWMKGMRFSIDIIWVKGDTVIDIHSSVLPLSETTNESNIPTYSPISAVDYVLEVPAGTVNNLGIKVGSSFTIQ